MYEQFIMVKHGASFLVHRIEDSFTIDALQPGQLHPDVCELVAAAQRSIARFYLIDQKWQGDPACSLKRFFSDKGWVIEEDGSVYNTP